MNRRIKKSGKYWSIDIELTNSLIFLSGVLVGLVVGKL